MKLIFHSKRLEVREIQEKDFSFFTELLTAPEIIKPIPQAQPSATKVQQLFQDFRDYTEDPLKKERNIWGVYPIGEDELIGLCALLKNEEGQREIGYRFRQKYWGVGYGTELTKELINYCFDRLNLAVLTADVNIENIGSVCILEKFFQPLKDFYNEADQCMDRRYILRNPNN